MNRFFINLWAIFRVLIVILIALGTAVAFIWFGATVLDHFEGTGEYFERNCATVNYYYDCETGYTKPEIKWILLLPAVLGFLALVGIYTWSQRDGGPYYYCPNCSCPSCHEDREQRKQDEDMALIAATTAAVTSTTIGLNS